MTARGHDRQVNAEEPALGEVDMEFEIRRATGAEAERLRLEQAQALKEVTEWLAVRRKSEPGPDHAASTALTRWRAPSHGH